MLLHNHIISQFYWDGWQFILFSCAKFLSDTKKKYSDLKVLAKAVHEKLQNALAARKVNESDLRKVERWCKEAEMKCNVEPSLDCATELLQEQVKQYKVGIYLVKR